MHIETRNRILLFLLIRLLRFEEKSVMQDEMKQLHAKYDEEERNCNKLERKLKKFSEDNVMLDQKLHDLQREQSIGMSSPYKIFTNLWALISGIPTLRNVITKEAFFIHQELRST